MNSQCQKSNPLTQEEIDAYLTQEDDDIRLELAYAYQIPKDVLFPSDYKRIMDDIDAAMQESEGV